MFQAAAQTAETHDVRHRTVAAGAACAEAYRNLLEQVNMVGHVFVIIDVAGFKLAMKIRENFSHFENSGDILDLNFKFAYIFYTSSLLP